MNTLGKEYSKEGLLEGVLEGKIALRNQEYSKEGFFIRYSNRNFLVYKAYFTS